MVLPTFAPTWYRSMPLEPFSTFKPLKVVCCAICVISAICCCTWWSSAGRSEALFEPLADFDRQGANALQVVDDGVQRAGGGLRFRHGIVRIVDGLIGAVDLRGELLADRETRGVVGGAVDAQTRRQTRQATATELACEPVRLFCAFSESILVLSTK